MLATARSVVVTAAGTPRGGEVLAHLSARAGVAMAANVLSFGGLSPFVVTRQVVGGQALEEMRLGDRPTVFTVAGHAVEATPAGTPGPATLVEHAPDVAEADLVARVVSTEEPAPDLSGGLKSARVVVGAGRGAGGEDGFDDLLELAELLDAPLGVSRVVTPWAGARTTSRWARRAAGSRPTSTSPAGSAAPSSTGPAAAAPRPSWPSTPTPTHPWSPRRRTR